MSACPMDDDTGEAPGSKVLCWITSMSPNPFRRRWVLRAPRIRSGRWPGTRRKSSFTAACAGLIVLLPGPV